MPQSKNSPNELFDLLIELNACQSLSDLHTFIENNAAHYFGWLGAQLVIDNNDVNNTSAVEHEWLSFKLDDGERTIGLLKFIQGVGKKIDQGEVDLFLSNLVSITSKFRLFECCRQQTLELERCRNRIDSIVTDLNAIEQIKSNFISIASHELRTPLTVTRGYVEILLDDDHLTEKQVATLNGVYKGVLKQEEILDSLFELAKFDTVSPVLNQERVWIGKLTREVVKKLSKPIQERGIVLSLTSDDDLDIYVDQNSIRKLILNLVENAIKFTPDHGSVTIDVKADVQKDDDGLLRAGVLISIKDSGVGIDHDQLDVIFTRFYQPKEKLNTHSSGKTKFKGSGLGLGLALSKAITLAHNGRIWAESAGYDEEKMPGSVFHVFLPLKK